MKPKPPTSLQELTDLVLAFREARHWKQFHNPKELAISLVVESSELLELMQWKSGPELDAYLHRKRTDLSDELADVMHSVLLLAHDLEIDLGEALRSKMAKMEKKYPVEKSRGKAKKYTELD